MATNIVFTFTATGQSSGSIPVTTLYANRDAAETASKRIVWLKYETERANPWEAVAAPGFDGVRGKFMSAKPRTHTIIGFLFGTEAQMKTDSESLLKLNTEEGFFTISGSALFVHKGDGLIVENVRFPPLGGAGAHWPFEIKMRDLGV